jgi:hypothetical protein
MSSSILHDFPAATPCLQNKTVFLCHGYYGAGLSSTSLGELIASFGYRVIVPNWMPDASDEEAFHGQLSFDQILSTHLDCWNSLSLDLSSTILCGHSFGGLIASRMYMNLPKESRPYRLGLMHPFFGIKNVYVPTYASHVLKKIPKYILNLNVYPVGITSNNILNNTESVYSIPRRTSDETIVTGLTSFLELRCDISNDQDISIGNSQTRFILSGQCDRIVQQPPTWIRDLFICDLVENGSHESWHYNTQKVMDEFGSKLRNLLSQ